MQIGLFATPFRLKEVSTQQGLEWDISQSRWAEEAGIKEVWFAEHYTLPSQPTTSPDLLIAAASRETSTIRLGAAAHILPYHHPVSLAHRLMELDHLTGGRYRAAFGAGSYRSDAKLFATLGDPGEGTDVLAMNRELFAENLDIILKIWGAGGQPFTHQGKYWSVDYTFDSSQDFFDPHLRPLQDPHPPIAIAGATPNSPTLRSAGQRGFMPMSVSVAPEFLKGHWAAYAGGAEEAGLVARRKDWYVITDCLVADTDAEAVKLAHESAWGRTYREVVLPVYSYLGYLNVMAPGIPEDKVFDYFVNERFYVGSPDTVVERIKRDYEESGGYGTLLTYGHDFLADPAAYRHHLNLLGREVGPRVAEL